MIPDFTSLFDLLAAFPDEQVCIAHLEELRWGGQPVSPFDLKSRVYKCAGGRYKCKNTGKYFNIKTGTIFEDTKIPLQKWFMAIYLLSSHKKGISSHQLAKDIDVTQKSAWFILHRLRYAFDHPNYQAALDNVVEVDETYVGGSEKNKHKSKRTEGTQGRSTKTKKPVVGIVERGGTLIAKVVDDTKKSTMHQFIQDNTVEGAIVITDEYRSYRNLEDVVFEHQIVNHSAKEFVNGMAHTNTIEGFWSLFKRGIDGIYHWVSVKHLQKYVTEFALRYNTRQLTTEMGRFNLILGNIRGRLKYQTLIAR